MKIFSFISTVLISVYSFGQDAYNYNQNYQINEYVKESEFKLSRTYQTYDGKKTVSQGKYSLTKIDLGYKDSEGNEAFALQMIRAKKLLMSEDTIYLMPDNKYYPTHLEGIRYDEGEPKEFGKFIILNGGEITQANIRLNRVSPQGLTTDPKYYVMYFEKDKPEFVFKGSGNGELKNSNDFMSKLSIDTKTIGGGMGSYYTVVPEYPGVPKMMEARNAYMDNMVESAKNTSYINRISKLVNEQDFIVYASNMTGWVDDVSTSKLRLNAAKDASGNITSLKVHKPFTDGKFYDKEKFFTECVKGTNGLFTYKGDKGTYALIPYDIYIVGCRKLSGKWVPDFVAVNANADYPKLLDFVAHSVASGDHSGFGDESSASWWCKTELEEYYDKDKDKYYFRTFFDNYVKALLK